MIRSLSTLALLAALAVGFVPSSASACPMCKDSIANDEGSNSSGGTGLGEGNGPASGLPSGFNNSVYVMLVAFSGTLGLVAYTLFRGGRN